MREGLPGFAEELEVKLIRPPIHPLRTEIGDLTELISSISNQGLLQPIVVRPLNDWFEVVAGNRRLAACKKLRMRKILCHVLYLSDKDAYEVSLTENVQHKTLDVVDEPRAFKRYVEEYGYGGESDLARRIGKSQQFVSQRIRLLTLPKEVLQKLTRRQVTFSHASELIGLSTNNQMIVSELIEQENLSSRSVRGVAKILKHDRILDSASDIVHEGFVETKRDDESSYVLNKCIAFLRTTLIRYDEIIRSSAREDLIVQESLARSRVEIHAQIDTLIRLQVRIRRHRDLPRQKTAYAGVRALHKKDNPVWAYES